MSFNFKGQQAPPSQNKNLQWERFTVPVGTNILGRMASTGWQIAHIEIDNTTTMWMQVNPGAFIIPPNTLGWATNLIPSTNSIDILFLSTGPSGIPTQSGGLPANVGIYNERLGNSPGSSYVDQLFSPYNQYSITLLPITTSTNPGTTVTTSILPLAGVGLSYIVYKSIMLIDRSARGLFNINVITTSGQYLSYGSALSARNPVWSIDFPGSGYLVGDNIGVNSGANCSSASDLYRILIYYSTVNL